MPKIEKNSKIYRFFVMMCNTWKCFCLSMIDKLDISRSFVSAMQWILKQTQLKEIMLIIISFV